MESSFECRHVDLAPGHDLPRGPRVTAHSLPIQGRMMARRTKQRKPAALAGRDTYHVIGPEGELVVKGEAAHALVVAQGIAERHPDGHSVDLMVERQSLFGPATTLYRVVRDAPTKTIYTFTVDPQD